MAPRRPRPSTTSRLFRMKAEAAVRAWKAAHPERPRPRGAPPVVLTAAMTASGQGAIRFDLTALRTPPITTHDQP